MNELKGKYAWTATVGEKGQIVIPKQAREIFGIKPGDKLVVLGEEGQGLALCKESDFMANVEAAMLSARRTIG